MADQFKLHFIFIVISLKIVNHALQHVLVVHSNVQLVFFRKYFSTNFHALHACAIECQWEMVDLVSCKDWCMLP